MTDRVRLSLFCPGCVPGYHLPFFSTLTGQVFAEHGLSLEILDPPPPPGSTNSVRVASGGSEFGLTGITYFLQALRHAGGRLPARFISTIHQRSPLGAIVPVESDISSPADLQGRLMGRGELTGWLADECQRSLADRGLQPLRLLPLGHGEAPYALGRGEIDAMGTFIDAMAGAGTKGGRAVRAVPLGAEIYSTGLLASDGVTDELAARMRQAVAEAFEAQRLDPETGVESLCRRFPEVRPEDARASWSLVEPYVFTGTPVGTMSQERWATTIEWLRTTHGFPTTDPEQVYRAELATSSPTGSFRKSSGVLQPISR